MCVRTPARRPLPSSPPPAHRQFDLQFRNGRHSLKPFTVHPSDRPRRIAAREAHLSTVAAILFVKCVCQWCLPFGQIRNAAQCVFAKPCSARPAETPASVWRFGWSARHWFAGSTDTERSGRLRSRVWRFLPARLLGDCRAMRRRVKRSESVEARRKRLWMADGSGAIRQALLSISRRSARRLRGRRCRAEVASSLLKCWFAESLCTDRFCQAGTRLTSQPSGPSSVPFIPMAQFVPTPAIHGKFATDQPCSDRSANSGIRRATRSLERLSVPEPPEVARHPEYVAPIPDPLNPALPCPASPAPPGRNRVFGYCLW